MKKNTIVLMLFLSATLPGAGKVFAQNINMNIEMKDGTSLSYDIDSVAKMTVTRIDTFPILSDMDIRYTPFAPYYDALFYIRLLDSITFEQDSIGNALLAVHDTVPSFQSVFRLIGPRKVATDAPIESITFETYEVDTNVIGGFPYGNISGDYRCSAWYGNRIYATPPATWFDIDSNLHIMHDSTFDPRSAGSERLGQFSLALNGNGDLMLSVLSNSYYVSYGNLIEYDLKSGNVLALDSTHQVSSAVYVPGTNNIIYYTYGSYSDTGKNPNTSPADAGYYLLDRGTGIRTFLLHAISDLGPGEIVNGFDISPDGAKLLYSSTSSHRAPFVIEYDLVSHIADTLNVPFNALRDRVCLWLRYNRDGSKILYDNYQLDAISGPLDDGSEVGIIDRATHAKQVLDVNPTNGERFVALFPQWSPDNRMIVYSLSGISPEPAGTVSGYSLYILKSVP